MKTIRRRLGCLLLSAVLLLSMIPAAFAAPTPGMDNFKRVNTYTAGTFSDVPEGKWYTDSIKAAYEYGLALGSDGKFDRTSNMTVATAVTLAARLHAIYHTGSTAALVQSSPWYQVYVDYALTNGIIEAGQFANYDKTDATRAQCAVMLSKAIPAAELPAINTVEDGAIPDVPADASYYEDIYALYRAGILTGNDDKGTFTPDATIDRTAFFTIATRLMDKSLRRSVTLENLNNNLYEDQYVRIQFKGAELNEGSLDALKFKVWNKGTAFTDGVKYPDMLVCLTDYSFGGHQTSRNRAPGIFTIVPAGTSVEWSYPCSLSDFSGSNISALFEINHGMFSGPEYDIFTGEGFEVAGTTMAYVPGTGLDGAAPNTIPPEITEGTLVYSDDNLNLYFLWHDFSVDYSVQNKTDDLMTIKCKSVSLGGKVDTDVFHNFTCYDHKAVLSYSSVYMSIGGVMDAEKQDGAGIVLDVTVGGKAYTVTVDDPNKPVTLTDAQLTEYAARTFRSVRYDYPSATGKHGYAIAFTDKNGDQCVMTYVYYQIIRNYSQTTLYNLTKGTRIEDPADYYSNQADRYYGANAIRYLELASQALSYENKAITGVRDYITTGKNTGPGVYVGASILNL